MQQSSLCSATHTLICTHGRPEKPGLYVDQPDICNVHCMISIPLINIEFFAHRDASPLFHGETRSVAIVSLHLPVTTHRVTEDLPAWALRGCHDSKLNILDTSRRVAELALSHTLEVVLRVFGGRRKIAFGPTKEAFATKPFLNHRAKNKG